MLIDEVHLTNRHIAVGLATYTPKELGKDPGPLNLRRPGDPPPPPVEQKKPGVWRGFAQRAMQGLKG